MEVSLHFLLRKRDVQALMVTVLLMKLPVWLISSQGAPSLLQRWLAVVLHHIDSSWPNWTPSFG